MGQLLHDPRLPRRTPLKLHAAASRLRTRARETGHLDRLQRDSATHHQLQRRGVSEMQQQNRPWRWSESVDLSLHSCSRRMRCWKLGGRVGGGAVLYCNTCPCLTCTIKIVQVGITEVVYSQSYYMDAEAAKVFLEAGVKLRQFSPPKEGLVNLSSSELVGLPVLMNGHA